MDKINWKQKLSSRKFWAAIAAVVIAIGTVLKTEPQTLEEISGVIMAVGALIAYILAEGYVDGKREEGDIIVNTEDYRE